MTPLAVSSNATDLFRLSRNDNSKEPAVNESTTSTLTQGVAEGEPIVPDGGERIMNFLCQTAAEQMMVGLTFKAFAEALVPLLASSVVEQPSILAWDFDVRLDDGRLRVVDADSLTPGEIEWLESRLNAHRQLPKLAAEFNDAVVAAFGDRNHLGYVPLYTEGLPLKDAIPGLAGTVDRDVKFMSLLRTVRDADCGLGDTGDYYRANRYELAAIKVVDLIVSPDTYRKAPSGELVVATSQKSSIYDWMA
ncbi:hypothetical protein [Luteibacter sp. RCC_6_2]|jgi:hypothetical protein|uniref:hypothetical protein n=1 Tax=Luteibacter sp. RCC_6_2 TaxID=3239223 RepID=UPI0035250FB9